MPKLIQSEHAYYQPIETWFCESDAEVSEIPASAPPGSIAEILTENGLAVKMKNSDGSWIAI